MATFNTISRLTNHLRRIFEVREVQYPGRKITIEPTFQAVTLDLEAIIDLVLKEEHAPVREARLPPPIEHIEMRTELRDLHPDPEAPLRLSSYLAEIMRGLRASRDADLRAYGSGWGRNVYSLKDAEEAFAAGAECVQCYRRGESVAYRAFTPEAAASFFEQ